MFAPPVEHSFTDATAAAYFTMTLDVADLLLALSKDCTTLHAGLQRILFGGMENFNDLSPYIVTNYKDHSEFSANARQTVAS